MSYITKQNLIPVYAENNRNTSCWFSHIRTLGKQNRSLIIGPKYSTYLSDMHLLPSYFCEYKETFEETLNEIKQISHSHINHGSIRHIHTILQNAFNIVSLAFRYYSSNNNINGTAYPIHFVMSTGRNNLISFDKIFHDRVILTLSNVIVTDLVFLLERANISRFWESIITIYRTRKFFQQTFSGISNYSRLINPENNDLEFDWALPIGVETETLIRRTPPRSTLSEQYIQNPEQEQDMKTIISKMILQKEIPQNILNTLYELILSVEG